MAQQNEETISEFAGPLLGALCLREEIADLEQYRELIALARAIVWRADARTLQFTFVSDYAEVLLGYPIQQWLDRPTFWREHIHPDDRKWATAARTKAIQSGEPHELEYRMVAADGKSVWLHDTIFVVSEEGRPARLIGVMIEKKAETGLRPSEKHLRLAIDTIPQQIWSGPADGTLDFCNSRCRSELGLTLDQLRGNGWQKILHPADRDKVMQAWHESVVNGTPFEVEARHRMADGQYRWSLTRGVPLRENGKVVRWFGSNTDIEEQKQAEGAHRKSEERWRRVFENSQIGVALLDSSLNFVETNEAYQKMVGYSADELQSLTNIELTYEEDRQPCQLLMEKMISGQLDHFEIEKRYVRKNGEIVWVHINGSSVGSGKDRLWIAMVRDVSERERLRAQVERERDRLRLLLDLGNRFVSKLEIREFFDALLDGVRRLAGWQSATILLPDATSQQLTSYLSSDNSYLPEGYTLPVKGSLQGDVYRSQKPVAFRIEDLPDLCSVYRENQRMQDIARLESVKAGCSLPLIHEGQVIGVLFLMTRIPKDPTKNDLNFLQELAALVAATLYNSLQFQRVTESREKLVSEKKYIEDQVRSAAGYEEVIGESPATLDVLRQVDAVAPTDSIVMILGESGTGKERIARVIHERSARSDQSFIKVDCAAIPAALMESELFGHEKGAFTGAISQKLGRFEVADKGTVFLDEIGEVSLELQTKLLRVLQDYDFQRLGSNRVRHLDVRVIAATNRNLEEMIEKGQFREDLYYRLKVFPITIPPLRERPEDIEPLVRHYVAKYARRMKKVIAAIPASAMEVFMRYPWPGNVRELQHFMERSVILSAGPILEAPLGELDQVVRHQTARRRRPEKCQTMEEIERESILDALKDSNWVIGGPQGAAKKLGLKRTTLASKIERLGICRP